MGSQAFHFLKGQHKMQADGAPAVDETLAPKELEVDAAPDKRKGLEKCTVAINPLDTTLNTMLSCDNEVLMSLSEGGFQYLLAGARANVGVKAGRYFFEAKILESRTPDDESQRGSGAHPPTPKHLVRLGFSTSSSGLFLGEGSDSVCFDSEGFCTRSGKKERSSCSMVRHQVYGVLLNLDPKSPNKNTLSLFKDGVRVSQPQSLPEHLHGKALFPTVTFRNATLQLNFGSAPLISLPFKCRLIQDASKDDAEVIKAVKPPKDGKYEVLFPVGLPDEGAFDWLDQFLKDNPEYSEISDRALLDWARLSGLHRPQGYSWRSSNDKPDMGTGLPSMDDLSVKKVLDAVLPVLQRNVVVMEVKGNLLKESRQQCLKRLSGVGAELQIVANVVIGEPGPEHKKMVQGRILADKKQAVTEEFNKERAEKEKARAQAKEEKEWKRKKLIDEKTALEKKVAEAKRVAEEIGETKKNDAEEEKEGGEATKETVDAKMAENDEAKEADEEEEKEEDWDKLLEQSLAKVVPTEEEKKLWFRKLASPDLIARELNHSFGTFSIPDKAEGFDDVRFSWQKSEQAAEYLRQWVLEKKLTERVETLQPSPWFDQKLAEWKKLLQQWRGQQSDNDRRSRATPVAPSSKKAQDAEHGVEGAAVAAGEEKKNGDDRGEDVDAKEDPTPTPAKPKVPKVEAEDVDVWDVEDVGDLGDGEPLFANFTVEDWALLILRFDLHLLVHAYRHDLQDPERPSFHESHLAYYYNKYFQKDLSARHFGVQSTKDILAMVDDSVELGDRCAVLKAMLSDDTPLENFVKLTEDARRERQLLLDQGDEAAALKFKSPPPLEYPAQGHGQYQSHRSGHHSQHGSRGGWQGGAHGGARQYSQMAPVGGAQGHGGPTGGIGAYPPPPGYYGAAPQGYNGYGAPPMPPQAVGYGGPPHGGGGYGGPPHAYGGGAQKRPYPGPPPSRYDEAPKSARTSYGGGASGGAPSWGGGGRDGGRTMDRRSDHGRR